MEPILVASDLDKNMRMEVNASDYITDGVLSMEYNNKEMLAVIRGLENWRHLLESTRFKFKMWTDHKNLEYFIKVQKLNRRQVRLALYLLRFDFTLKHVLGIKMGKTDRLSKRLDLKVGIENNNSNQIFIKDYWIHNLYEIVVERPEVDIVKKIKKARDKDKEVVRVVEEMKKAGVKNLRGDEWEIDGGLILKEGRIYVPKDEELRVEIIWFHHNIPVAGHRGK